MMADFHTVLKDLVLLVRQNTIFSTIFGVLLTISIIFFRYLPVLLIVWSGLAGVSMFHVLFKRVSSLPNLFGMFERDKLAGVRKSTLKEAYHGRCPVCGNDNCNRHRGELYHTNYQPWIDLKIPKRVDDALSEFFELVLKEYVYSWYSESMSKDEEFVKELRTSLRYTISVILRRLKQIDLPTVIIHKLIKAGLSHLDVYLRAKRKARWGEDIQDLTIKQYGNHLHVAVRNRHAELEYIRNLCELLFPFIVSNEPQDSKCTISFLRELLSRSLIMPAMDVLANPDVVNKILEVFFDEEPMAKSTDPQTEPVNILKAFCEARPCHADNALHYETSEILSNSTLLFPFLQFMRREGALNLLQFCLTVEDFNRRSLVPDMTDQQKRDLHLEAKELYNLYFAPDAMDRINFEEVVVKAFQDIVTGPPEGVIRMRKTLTLFDVKQYGNHLHVAVRNRHAELEYIRNLCELLFPFIVSNEPQDSKCTISFLRELLSRSLIMPAMDVLANPDVVNKILEVFFDEEPMAKSTDPPTEPVNILKAFCEARPCHADNALHYETSEILSNSTLLFPFLQFMRREGALNLLQFCLTVEDFNRRSLVPDMTDQQKRDLHLEAKELYNLYFAPDAMDRINFEEVVVKAFQDIVTGPPEGVIRMRKTLTLFEAYEYVFSLLESTYCPLFHHSEEYYTLLCGKRRLALARAGSRVASKKPSETFAAMSKLGSRIKGVFKGQTDGESLFNLDLYEESSQPSSDVDQISDDEDTHQPGVSSPQHDLSAWRVSIPGVGMKMEGGKEGFVFIIDIQRVDVREGDGERNSWRVERMYHEFYALEQKLREFHGVFEDAQLPVRRPFGSKSQDFMEKKRPGLEKYLRVLLTKPILRGSQLLYTFLTTNEEFVNKIFGDVNLGKFVRSVSTKVIKERGQHLERFLVTFLASVEAARPKASADEDETDPDLTEKEMLSSLLFENNAGQELDRPNLKEPWTNPEASYMQLNGIIQYVLYLARSVFDVPVWMHQMIVTFAKIFGNSLETYLDYFINTKTEMLKSEQMVEHIMYLLRDVLFFDEDPPRTDAQKLERKEFAFQQMLKFFPSIVPKVLGEEKFYDGCKIVFDALQYPKLNKQLSYILLDIVIKEIFPELSDEDDADEEASQYQEDHYEKD
eukprot:XP_011664636.1 PREDICTED: sorting nexin-14 [Strongylocentrotus purpuratus]